MSALLFVVIVLTAGAASERFSQGLTEEERRVAGLDRLTAEQLAALDALVLREREGGEKAAGERARAELASEVKARVRAEVREEEKQRQLAATRVLSRLVGRYEGWARGTEFRLENGQVWRHTGSDVHYVTPVEAPAILIEKVFGGWRLYDAAGGWCPVTRVK